MLFERDFYDEILEVFGENQFVLVIKCHTVIYITYRSFYTEASRVVLWKKVFLEISQNSLENTYARVSFLIKLQALYV